jgi:hypothetical protein
VLKQVEVDDCRKSGVPGGAAEDGSETDRQGYAAQIEVGEEEMGRIREVLIVCIYIF